MALMFNLSVIMRNNTAYSLLQVDVSIVLPPFFLYGGEKLTVDV